MSNRSWTDSQKSAIYTSNTENSNKCNILVSAAAGSGKTAVLVERIIKKILPDSGKPLTDINRLLVVTFTNAAAQEMKDRVNQALYAQLKSARENQDSEKAAEIKRQMLLLHTADITTIDAFCMKILRENFSLADVDPAFSIADEGQAAILAEETMEELFDQLYKEKNEEFMTLLDLYSATASHKRLSEIVKYIYRYTRSIPFPLEWLREKVSQLSYENQAFADTDLYKNALKLAKGKIQGCYSGTKKALTFILGTEPTMALLEANPPEKKQEVYDHWGAYYKAFYQDFILISALLSSDAPQEILKNHTFSSFARNDKLDDKTKEYLKFIRENTKTTLKEIAQEFSRSTAEEEEISREKILPVAQAFYSIIDRFHQMYMAKKSAMSLLEFHDVEQLVAELFRDNPQVCQSLKNRYDEILMDEYQDTSMLQEEIFSRIKKDDNIFMVGDMKQSIYRFRSSDPSIFKSKIDTYSQDDHINRKIILSNNFRSQTGVLDSINDVFSAIMTETCGELDYDDSQKLNPPPGKEEENTVKSTFCELVAVADEDEDEETPEKHELEARFIASEITRLKAEGYTVRDSAGERPIENRDFAILLSKYKNVAEIYANTLNDAGIECHAESGGYFDQSEIRLVMCLLQVISNPYTDIPLIGVLRSPIASFTDDEIVIIRKCKKGKFYSALKELVALNKAGALTQDDELYTAEKAEKFIENLTRWRSYSRYMPTDKLIWTLYEETDFYAFCGGMYDGEAVQANLRLLFLRAKQFEDNGFCGLFNFIRYIDNLKKRDTDLSSAKLMGEDHNAVRIMTIHKSKGLEMPVVFIAGCGNAFRQRGDSSHIVLHKNYGIGLDLVDFENSFRTETFKKSLIKSAIEVEEVSEEIRKLYVAMTRARDKLYVLSCHAHDELKGEKSPYIKNLTRWKNSTSCGQPDLSPYDVLGSKCYADWVAPVAMCSENWEFKTVFSSGLTLCHQEKEAKVQNTQIPDIDAILSYTYPYADATTLPTKVTVSQLKGSQDTVMTPMPDFLSDKTETGAFYGTATHNFIRHINLCQDMSLEYIEAQLEELEKSGLVSPAEAKKVNCEKVYRLFSSDLGKRMLASRSLYREQPFEVTLPSGMLFPDSDADEQIILQGVIDCYFEEDDGLVLVDYKTDSFKSTDEIHKKYDLQLKLYCVALEKITGKRVKDKFFYLFFDNSVL